MTYDRLLAGPDSRKPLPSKCVAPDCDRSPRTRIDSKPVCGKHEYRYQRYRSFDLPKKSVPAWRTCNIDGCSNRSRSRLGSLCETHYYRRYRTGTFDDPQYKRRYKGTQGYIKLVGIKGCDIANNGSVLEHRKVLFESIGHGPHDCYWCGKAVNWSKEPRDKAKLVVDHLNNIKDDNRIDNLVPSCHGCNSTRGLFMAWVHKHKDDPVLLEMFQAAQAGKFLA